MIFEIIFCAVFICKIFIFLKISFCREEKKILVSLNWENVAIIFNYLLTNRKILSRRISNKYWCEHVTE